jgi:hypothetical protein
MKRVLTNFLVLGGISLLALASCKKSGVEATSNGGKAGTLTANATTLPLNKAMVNDTTPVINFSFTAPNYGYKAAVTNTLQIDVPGDNWKTPTTFSIGTDVYSQSFSTPVFNSLVLKLNLPANQASSVEVRVMHSLGTYVAPIYSNVVTLSVTPFNLSSWLYVVGAFQGWSTSAADSLESATGNGIYTGVLYFAPNSGGSGQNQFLILPAKL